MKAQELFEQINSGKLFLVGTFKGSGELSERDIPFQGKNIHVVERETVIELDHNGKTVDVMINDDYARSFQPFKKSTRVACHLASAASKAGTLRIKARQLFAVEG